MKVAQRIGRVNKEGARGVQVLYRVTPPVKYDEGTTEYLVSSAVAVMGEPETYIFPADEDGRIVSWLELDGSMRGDLDCDEAIRRAGYEITTQPTGDNQ